MADTRRSDEERETPAWRTGVDLNAMSDQEIMELVTAAIERLAPTRLSEVIEAVQARRKVKEEEVKNALLTEFRERALQMGLSLETLLGGARRTGERPNADRRPHQEATLDALNPQVPGPSWGDLVGPGKAAQLALSA